MAELDPHPFWELERGRLIADGILTRSQNEHSPARLQNYFDLLNSPEGFCFFFKAFENCGRNLIKIWRVVEWSQLKLELFGGRVFCVGGVGFRKLNYNGSDSSAEEKLSGVYPDATATPRAHPLGEPGN